MGRLIHTINGPWAAGSQSFRATAASGELARRIRGTWLPEQENRHGRHTHNHRHDRRRGDAALDRQRCRLANRHSPRSRRAGPRTMPVWDSRDSNGHPRVEPQGRPHPRAPSSHAVVADSDVRSSQSKPPRDRTNVGTGRLIQTINGPWAVGSQASRATGASVFPASRIGGVWLPKKENRHGRHSSHHHHDHRRDDADLGHQRCLLATRQSTRRRRKKAFQVASPTSAN